MDPACRCPSESDPADAAEPSSEHPFHSPPRQRPRSPPHLAVIGALLAATGRGRPPLHSECEWNQVLFLHLPGLETHLPPSLARDYGMHNQATDACGRRRGPVV